MGFFDTFRTGLEAIATHRMRSVLTMLGILIGIAAVILTVGLGQGAQKTVSEQINSLGSNLLLVSPGSSTSTSTGIRGGFGSASTLTSGDAVALADKTVAPDVAAVAPSSSRSLTVIAGSTNWTTTVVGSTADWTSVRNRSLAQGSFFTEADVTGSAALCVLGSETAAELFSFANPVGQEITVNGVTLTVDGVLDSAGSSSSTNEDDQIIVPITTAQARLFGGTNRTSVSTIYVKAASSGVLSAAYQEVNAELLALHKISDPAEADFTITTQQSILAAATSVDKTLTNLLAGIAAISLLVGGIGVMNIMLVSVTERIREIGLRKALGATPAVIRRQFLVEACVLGLVGGVLGVVLGLVGAGVIPHLTGDRIVVSGVAAAGSIIIALIIGIVFGVYPASRAARLAPIDALRSE